MQSNIRTLSMSTLNGLFETNRIDLQRSALLGTAPVPMPVSVAWERIEGMMLGLAIGDALGNTTESQLPAERRARYGEIRDCLPWPTTASTPTIWQHSCLLCKPERTSQSPRSSRSPRSVE